ncbi:MAG: MBOAT family O-acyltransferase [Flavobacteriales bacterium]
MLFNSLEYLLFLPLVFVLYWFVFKKTQSQNVLLLIASYVFYAAWDYRFLALIILSSGIDYLSGTKVYNAKDQRDKKRWLLVSVVMNLGALAAFKYFDFFISSWIDLMDTIGVRTNLEVLNIVFPVGISFYTFQTLSYTIDIYRGKMEPTKDWVAFFGFVSFFPQLVAGPIERAKDLLPQFNQTRAFDYNTAVDGLRQILWGMFKKVVVADNCAILVNEVFGHYEEAQPLQLLAGVCLFFIQVYGDFSGYSDIAIGSAKLFGFKLSLNFSTPFFSRSFGEFWRRWHITLNDWFRDYVYFPLGGNRKGRFRMYFNIVVVFGLCGFWHGAQWTFIFWGLANALLFVVERLLVRDKEETEITGVKLFHLGQLVRMIIVFLAVALTLVFFRAKDLDEALGYFGGMLNFSGQHSFDFSASTRHQAMILKLSLFIPAMVIGEWLSRGQDHPLQRMPKNRGFRYSIYIVLTLLCIEYLYGDVPFVYFQF